MGFYINPPDVTKEEFLTEHGKHITKDQAAKHDCSSDSLVVVLLDNNGAFSAAGIAYEPGELEYFVSDRPNDKRHKKWYLVKKEVLKPYLPARYL